jgi:glycosyltransferase involved in cell wall biosynthesis
MTAVSIGLSIVIPVYEGAPTIGTLVHSLTRLSPFGGFEIILVNDGSSDNSDAICVDLVRDATVPMLYVEHGRNFGEHNAVMTGLRHARGSYVVTMDDDLQNPVDEVVRIYDHARLNDWDVVYSRYAVTAQPGWRRVCSRFANKIADWLLDKPSGLYLSSFRCMSAFVVKAVTRYSGPYPYIDGLIMQSTRRIDSMEVLHMPRTRGQSNYTMRRLIRLWLNLVTSFSLVPLRLAVWAGAAMATGGGIGAVAVVVEALTSRSIPSGWASTMTVLLLVSGVQSIILGILGEYVGRTFLSASAKPQAIVRRLQRNNALLDEPE